jgi:hypothetical protein
MESNSAFQVAAFQKNEKQEDGKQVCFTTLLEKKYGKQRRNGSATKRLQRPANRCSGCWIPNENGAVQKGESLSFFRKNQNSQMKALCASMFLSRLYRDKSWFKISHLTT